MCSSDLLLTPALSHRPGTRVVTMTSMEVRWARLRLDDLNSEQRYGRDRAYAQSKLANLAFAMELDRRMKAGGRRVVSVAAHPGWAATDQRQGWIISTLTRRFAQPAARGALPALYAATVPDIDGGSLVGPDGWQGMRGHPRLIAVPRNALRVLRPEITHALWQESERLTGVTY